jgi:hypothetical protein
MSENVVFLGSSSMGNNVFIMCRTRGLHLVIKRVINRDFERSSVFLILEHWRQTCVGLALCYLIILPLWLVTRSSQAHLV